MNWLRRVTLSGLRRSLTFYHVSPGFANYSWRLSGLSETMTRFHSNTGIGDIVRKYSPQLEFYENLYRDLHLHPELSTLERKTSDIVADQLESIGFDVKRRIGGYGVAGILSNGGGSTVLLRSELDALPIMEETGLPYASHTLMKDTDGIEKPVSHACGHDMHIACLLAASHLLYEARARWSGCLVVIFQPNEEKGGGARAMIKDGLYQKHKVPKPDVVLGQHVVNIRTGFVATRKGYSLAGKSVFQVTVWGRGGHGSAPQDCIDPVVTVAYIITRLQCIVSREIDPNKMVLVTCGSVHAGDAPNVIPDSAVLKVDIRAYSPDVLDNAVGALHRIIKAECEASGMTKNPEIKRTEHVPPLVCNETAVAKITKEFKDYFGQEHTEAMKLDTAADDFSILAPNGVPYAYWNFGSEDHQKWQKAHDEGRLNELPGNHSSKYAPLVEPTLKTGMQALCVAALSYLA